MSKRSFLLQALGSLSLGFFLFYFSTQNAGQQIHQSDFSSLFEKKVIVAIHLTIPMRLQGMNR